MAKKIDRKMRCPERECRYEDYEDNFWPPSVGSPLRQCPACGHTFLDKPQSIASPISPPARTYEDEMPKKQPKAEVAGTADYVTVPDLSALPVPDQHGNYWFCKPGGVNSPAILPIRSDGYPKASYFVILGRQGILWDGIKFQVFRYAQDAIKALRKVYQE